ncbi:MAG: DUF1801 domain-containing protein [Nonlabens sp.]|uniref:YdeI/OmpD-associated family protein n=1 Tax=Nonlabens sp. TaxID=1888209 RepID=UPI003EF6B4FB
MNKDIKNYLENLTSWKAELSRLHEIITKSELKEAFKWMHPCYTINDKNVIIIHGFKDYCAIMFFKGVLLKDPEDILVQQTENVQATRQIRFTRLVQIVNQESIIEEYIKEAIEIEKSGKEVPMKKTSDFEVPEELEFEFNNDKDFEKAFYSLTPGRQKGYLLHFTQPKQSKTKTARIVKNMERIKDGYGFHDCTCGLSKRKPNCDGSHKQLES